MAYGIEIINNNSKVVIDEQYEVMQVISIHYVETLPNTVDTFLPAPANYPDSFIEYENVPEKTWQWFVSPASSTWTGEITKCFSATSIAGETKYYFGLQEVSSSTGGTGFYIAKCLGIREAEEAADDGYITLPNGSGYGVEVFNENSKLVFTTAARLVGPLAASKITLEYPYDVDDPGVKIGGATLASSSYPRWAWVNNVGVDYSTGTVKSPGKGYGHVIEYVSQNDIRVRYREINYSGFVVNINTKVRYWAIAELGDFSWW